MLHDLQNAVRELRLQRRRPVQPRHVRQFVSLREGLDPRPELLRVVGVGGGDRLTTRCQAIGKSGVLTFSFSWCSAACCVCASTRFWRSSNPLAITGTKLEGRVVRG